MQCKGFESQLNRTEFEEDSSAPVVTCVHAMERECLPALVSSGPPVFCAVLFFTGFNESSFIFLTTVGVADRSVALELARTKGRMVGPGDKRLNLPVNFQEHFYLGGYRFQIWVSDISWLNWYTRLWIYKIMHENLEETNAYEGKSLKFTICYFSNKKITICLKRETHSAITLHPLN